MSPGGEVTTPSYPETLHVIRLDRSMDKTGGELPPAFIEVGDWTYPLVRGKSPIMKSNYGESIYMKQDRPVMRLLLNQQSSFSIIHHHTASYSIHHSDMVYAFKYVTSPHS